MLKRLTSIILVGLVSAASLRAVASAPLGPPPMTHEMILHAAQTVYLGNLERRANGIGPLRWNRQLTEAAYWYAWDSTENRPAGFCGHQDSEGLWPSNRITRFGFRGRGGAENAFCGYVTPEDAIGGWMRSDGHRANLLDPNSREIGVGSYRRGDGRGYVTQDFGSDPASAPVIINNEAPTALSPQVNLYIYDRDPSGGAVAFARATEMQVANDACFSGAAWEPFTREKSWTLASGPTGWRTVYVRTRDALGKTAVVSDSIYYGAATLPDPLDLSMLTATNGPGITLRNVDSGGLPKAQFSEGWLLDDTFDTFKLLWGSGEQAPDREARGGTAFRLGPPGDLAETSAWLWTTEFYRNIPLVAYVRLKVAANTATDEVARVGVTGGAPLRLKGTDFSAPNRYQEFPIPFTFAGDAEFLIVQFWRNGSTDVFVDGVTFFSAPETAQTVMTWRDPAENYRGQGVWVRFTNGGSHFSPVQEATSGAPSLSVTPGFLIFESRQAGAPIAGRALRVTRACPGLSWQVTPSANWLRAATQWETVQVDVDAARLGAGLHFATLTVTPSDANVEPVRVPVTVQVGDRVRRVFLPLMRR